MKVSPSAFEEIDRALAHYTREVEETNLSDKTKQTYLRHANTFVRWLADDFTPGLRTDVIYNE